MKVVFYSTSSDICVDSMRTFTLPTYADDWNAVASAYSECTFFAVFNQPGTFLYNSEVISKTDCRIHYITTDQYDAQNFAAEILALQPDIAIAASAWGTQYDWQPVMDAMIADFLRNAGVYTICNLVSTSAVCFDKYKTHIFLERYHFPEPKTVYIQHSLFWCDRGHCTIHNNVYKNAILLEIQKLNYPVIVKDTVGLSSYKMEVHPTYNSICAYLRSKKNNSDRIVQEYIDGIQAGTEIHGSNGQYIIYPPFLFSVNRYGITSPKQSVKIGPLSGEQFCLSDLNTMLFRLACELRIDGIAQVDLVFCNGKWIIIEVNPRLSGMSTLYAAAQKKSLLQMMLDDLYTFSVTKASSNSDRNKTNIIVPQLPYTCNFKLPLVSSDVLQKLYKLPFVQYVNQVKNMAARQEREKGYCEIIFGTTDSVQELLSDLELLRTQFPSLVDDIFYSNAQNLAKLLMH